MSETSGVIPPLDEAERAEVPPLVPAAEIVTETVRQAEAILGRLVPA